MVECESINNAFALFRTISFNRYMVECELITSVLTVIVLRVLIDTWWNVNKGQDKPIYQGYRVLIDTWWNVNHREFLDLSIIYRF